MQLVRALSVVAVASLACLALGCGGGPAMAPVSGVVTLDGAPLADAVVTFQPKAVGGNMYPGQSSQGKTDQNGRYSLEIIGTGSGAILGPNRVQISAFLTGKGGDPASDRPGAQTLPKNRVPAKYNEQSTLEFDVPPGGTSSADFKLTTN
jgi:hypothetical protein